MDADARRARSAEAGWASHTPEAQAKRAATYARQRAFKEEYLQHQVEVEKERQVLRARRAELYKVTERLLEADVALLIQLAESLAGKYYRG